MAGFQMPKRGDGAAMLRDLRDEERPPLEVAPKEVAPKEVMTVVDLSMDQKQPISGHLPVLTEVRTYGSTEGSKPSLTDAGTEGRKPARKAPRTGGSKEARPQARKEGQEHAAEDTPPNILEVVEEALTSREPLVGGVKATVDMSPELSTRAKRYLADHRGQNTRQVLIALFDAFLSAKGY